MLYGIVQEGDEYCMYCGTELSVKIDRYFDSKTGRRVEIKICRKCHPCDHEYKANGFWKALFSADYTCCKCGQECHSGVIF